MLRPAEARWTYHYVGSIAGKHYVLSRFEGAKRLKIMSAMKGVGEITQNMIRC